MYLLLFLTYILTSYIGNNHEKKSWTREKILDPRNTHEKNVGSTKYPREKFWTHEIPTRKNFEHTKYQPGKILDTRAEIFDPRNTHERKLWTHEILTRGNYGHTKYQPEEILDTRNTHKR